MKTEEVLKKYWGYDCLRASQKRVIENVLEGHDTLALLPTGGGKSICYQLPSLLKKGITIIISPLISLMNDQIATLKKKGIIAYSIHSGIGTKRISDTLDNCIYGNVKLLYVSPERIQTLLFLERFKMMDVSLIAVDESHCISQWGYDFRPSYLNINILRKTKPEIPILALTATATKKTIDDIAIRLNLRQPKIIKKSFKRDNISYFSLETDNIKNKLYQILQRVKGSGIIYAYSRKKVELIASFLSSKGISADYYHAGLNNSNRDKKQTEWKNNKIRVIVATSAFGMGIDKSDVRVVIHLGIPDSPESYFQESGRAGRDGKKSFAIILYQKSDINLSIDLLTKKFLEKPALSKTYQSLANYFQIGINSTCEEPLNLNLYDLCEKFNLPVATTYYGIKNLEQMGLLYLKKDSQNGNTIIFIASPKQVNAFKKQNEGSSKIINYLVRNYDTIFNEKTVINEHKIANHLKLDRIKIEQQLIFLEKNQLLSYGKLKGNELSLVYKGPRIDSKSIFSNFNLLVERKKELLIQQQKMIEYCQDKTNCKNKILLEYFGETLKKGCGNCDYCQGLLNKTNLSTLELKKIEKKIKLLTSNKFTEIDYLLIKLNTFTQSTIKFAISYLVDEKKLILNGTKIKWHIQD